MSTTAPKESVEKTEAVEEGVDANGDGIIDKEDISVLMKKSNALFEQTILPYLKKAGLVTSDGEVVVTERSEKEEKIKTNLTAEDQAAYFSALKEWEDVNAQVDATTAAVIPSGEAILELMDAVGEWQKQSAKVKAGLQQMIRQDLESKESVSKEETPEEETPEEETPEDTEK